MQTILNWIANLAGSFLWSSLNALMRACVFLGLIKQIRLGAARVISVGNLQVGGSGKTPLVAQIAREGLSRGLLVCILTRGYRGSWEKRGGLLCPRVPGSPEANVLECGDEAALLRDLLPEVYIGVGANRIQAYARAKTARGSDFDLVILDDGLQHFRIARDLDVIALTSKTWGQILHRDFKTIIARADLLVWTKGKHPPRVKTPLVKTHFSLPRVSQATEVWLITGVADPAQVEASVLEAGYRLQTHVVFPDHEPFEKQAALKLLERCKDAGAQLAMTGKDFVKWKTWLGENPSVIVLEPEIKFLENRALWDQLLWGWGK
jgi:tetraacyldisaccharide 4'-kinase